MERQAAILAFSALLCLLLLSGCTTSVPAQERLNFTNYTPTYDPIENQTYRGLDVSEPCACMYCQNTTGWLGSILNTILPNWFDSSLDGGSCWFETCNGETFIETLNDTGDNIYPRVFMYGVGPSFVSADAANRYCNYSLQLAPRWMKSKLSEPRVPLPSRATCWLKRDTLPVYIYYTEGNFIDPVRTGQIADRLDGVGPALVTTEVDFDSSDALKLAAVKEQVEAYDNCDECLTVLAVKINDYYALESILSDPTTYSNGKNLSEMVDIVGFGFRANDYTDCTAETSIGEAFIFSRTILTNYSKPTIWLYAGVANGNSSDGSCNWSDEGVNNFYQNIFAITQPMASSGIIGVMFYEFTDGTGPLPCNGVQGCNYGLMSGGNVQKHPAINAWSDLCQYFGVQQFRSPVAYSRNGYGFECDNIQPNNKMFNKITLEINSGEGLDFSNVSDMARVKYLGCGGVCVSDSKLSKVLEYDGTTNQFSAMMGVDPCLDFPVIDELADDQDFSAMYMRSVISQESQFDQWVVSCSSGSCLTSFSSMDEICQAAGYGPNCPAHTLGGGRVCTAGLGGTHFCAFGMAQCIEGPGDTSSATNGCRGQDNFYNPFDPAESVCCGLNKMRTALDNSEQFVRQHETWLSACPDGYKPEEFGWLTYYLASLEYYIGSPQRAYESHWSGFLSQRDTPNPCDGEADFVEYLKPIPCTRDPNCRKYPQQIMSRYIDGVDNECDSDCPGK